MNGIDSKRIIYIMGDGRSGSTLLDIVLGFHPEIKSLGELSVLYRRWFNGGFCSCLKSYDSCPFWSQVREKHSVALGPREVGKSALLVRSVEGIFYLPLLVLGILQVQKVKKYGLLMHSLFEAIVNVSGLKVLVDSSKSARGQIGRVLAMKKICGFDIKVIHLVRDGRGVMYSRVKGRNDRVETFGKLGPFLAGISWLTTNVMSLLVGRLYFQGEVLRVNYEDFVLNPRNELQRISRFVGIDLDIIMKHVEQDREFRVGHITGGNRMRKKGTIRIGKDFAWQKKLPVCHWLFFDIFIWPFASFFGFAPPLNPVRVKLDPSEEFNNPINKC
jgi:Sulfotransferase domain